MIWQRIKGWLFPAWLRHLVTERDNETLDAKRMIALAGTVEYLWLPIHSVAINHSPMDFQSFALGLAAILTSVGAMLGLASSSERPPNG
ncbi:hypothetical protein [Phenylobacterium soli]|uniref:Uncharacterized protein n=1 Tax=Phenylobacterium soli TaxID=2170551 RepID=A0A328AAH3_9CAUL|nr:hypothetical protein [Phenylobacterium soli]RAK51186.1 hypothetical protein DJ017_19705 [Phenylobacterium soli]